MGHGVIVIPAALFFQNPLIADGVLSQVLKSEASALLSRMTRLNWIQVRALPPFPQKNAERMGHPSSLLGRMLETGRGLKFLRPA